MTRVHGLDERRRDEAIRDLALEQHGVVTRAQLVSLGVPSSTVTGWVRCRRLERLGPGAYVEPGLLDDWSVLAGLCLAVPGAVASHRAAALLHGLDGVEVAVAEITVPGSRRPRRGIVHRSDDLAGFEVVQVQGIPCTDVTRTLCDLGAVVGLDVLERALESGLRTRATTLPRLRWRADALTARGRSGPSRLRQVLERRPAGAPPTGSDLETLFLQAVRRAGIAEPQRQHRVVLPSAASALLDLAWPEQRVFVETDGWADHGTPRAFAADRRRQNGAVILGWRPLRFTWDQVTREPERCTDELRALLASPA